MKCPSCLRVLYNNEQLYQSEPFVPGATGYTMCIECWQRYEQVRQEAHDELNIPEDQQTDGQGRRHIYTKKQKHLVDVSEEVDPDGYFGRERRWW